MLILKKKHDLVVESLEREIVELNEIDINRLTEIEKLKKNSNELLKELDEAKKAVEDMEKKLEEYRLANVAMSKIYNNINNKLWCNDESARQLRILAQDIREADTFKKMYIAKYLDEISLRVGGGEKNKFVEVKDLEEGAQVVG